MFNLVGKTYLSALDGVTQIEVIKGAYFASFGRPSVDVRKSDGSVVTLTVEILNINYQAL
jgi:hypothetical protein